MANLLLTCATKLTVNGTTTAPEHLMVCGNARFVNSGTNNIYMGTSHGAVDIDFNRAASQDLKIRTYSGGWNTALRILGTGVFACSYLQSPTLCATTCVIAHSLRQTTNQQYICLYGGCNDSSPGGMKFMSCGGTLRGYVYYDGTSNFGLLNCSGQWAIRIVGNQSSNSCMYTCHPLEAATCLQSPILCATGCVKTERIQALGGLSCFSAPSGGSNFDDWECSPITIRERGLVTTNQNHCCYSPNINFHWAGRVSNSLWMDAAGNFNFGSYNGANVPSADGRLNTAILYGSTCVVSPILCTTTCINYGSCATSKIAGDGDNLKHTTQYGFISIGPGNSSYAHFTTDRAQFYFNKKLVVNAGQVESYDEDLILQRTSSGTNRIKITTDTTHICQYTNIAGKLAVNASGLT